MHSSELEQAGKLIAYRGGGGWNSFRDSFLAWRYQVHAGNADAERIAKEDLRHTVFKLEEDSVCNFFIGSSSGSPSSSSGRWQAEKARIAGVGANRFRYIGPRSNVTIRALSSRVALMRTSHTSSMESLEFDSDVQGAKQLARDLGLSFVLNGSDSVLYEATTADQAWKGRCAFEFGARSKYAWFELRTDGWRPTLDVDNLQDYRAYDVQVGPFIRKRFIAESNKLFEVSYSFAPYVSAMLLGNSLITHSDGETCVPAFAAPPPAYLRALRLSSSKPAELRGRNWCIDSSSRVAKNVQLLLGQH